MELLLLKGKVLVGSLRLEDEMYMFTYSSCYKGEPLISFPDKNRVYKSSILFPLFKNRLMPKSRGDYWQYLQWLGLEPNVTPMDILGRSGGRKVTDDLSIISKEYTHFFVDELNKEVEIKEGDKVLISKGQVLTSEGVVLGKIPNNYIQATQGVIAKVNPAPCPRSFRVLIAL